MGTFTIPLKRVIELTGGTTDVVGGSTVLTGGNIGLASYPIFDESYRSVLTGKIIDHFWNREIGLETIDMFQLAMRRKMNEIMPYYNKLYKSELIEYGPLSTVNIKTVANANGTQSGESSGTSDSTSNATGSSRSVSSDTPQTQLQGNADYATSATDVSSVSTNAANGTQSGSETQTTEQDTTSETTGYQGAASDLIMRYRESLLNIDMLVIGQLEDCFMQVWDNGDEYTNGRLYC